MHRLVRLQGPGLHFTHALPAMLPAALHWLLGESSVRSSPAGGQLVLGLVIELDNVLVPHHDRVLKGFAPLASAEQDLARLVYPIVRAGLCQPPAQGLAWDRVKGWQDC